MSVDRLPLLNNRFTIDIDCAIPEHSRRDIAVSSVTGLCSCRNHFLHSFVYKFFGFICRDYHANRIELRRALDTDHFFFDWHRANLQRRADLRTLTIYQLDQNNEKPINAWRLFHCWVHTWRGPEFDAINADVAYETMTLSYRTLNWLDQSDIT